MKKMSVNDFLQITVDHFNNSHPCPCDVEVTLDDGQKIETRTRKKAHLLGGHTPVIWLDGISGCYRLDRVRPI
ncbi:hypothetical protein [Dethiosulfatarculus sandiegensis]|uniref:Uncharacterized protein n=1 Tax=Dethiosulfatarculus sandiegensis TaxID=1429043 RepID=A0A0D2JA16_9BACT|nr:hypothetical protein [Dethiosulfatarculus sandiegensis]KIX14989.1 hypothetical protein X474_05805 [Dethiosulfatarculus sandiegensis]